MMITDRIARLQCKLDTFQTFLVAGCLLALVYPHLSDWRTTLLRDVQPADFDLADEEDSLDPSVVDKLGSSRIVNIDAVNGMMLTVQFAPSL